VAPPKDTDVRRLPPGLAGLRVVMLLENDLYPQDVRVRDEALALVRAGCAVHVIAPRGPGQARREELEGVSVERFKLRMDHRGRVLDLLREYVAAHLQLTLRSIWSMARGADVIHAHNPPDSLFVAGLIGRALGRRFVFDQHDNFADLAAAKFGRSTAVRIARLLQGASLRLADLILVTNERQAEIARAQLARDGSGAGSIRIVRNGPRAEILSHRAPLRGGVLSDPQLVYVGALEVQDGAIELPEMLAALRDRHGLDARMTVVGWGTQLESIRRRLRELGLADAAWTPGRLSHEQVLEIVAGADICLDPAPCNEFNHRTTMVKLGEYLALGRPVVAFALEETARTAGEAAVLVDCGDLAGFVAAIASLCADPVRRIALARRAREVARGLVWERSQQQLLAGYATLVRG
jgi:glycosyltransferase involved in cell wall biosynthesis